MTFESFLDKHLIALEADQIRYNLMLGLINRAKKDPGKIRFWSLGEGVACAVQTPPHYLVLGGLDQTQCDELAQKVKELDFLGCSGAGDMAKNLAASLGQIGVPHELGMPQRIYVLDQPPTFPKSEGRGRKATPDDADLFCDWYLGFYHEAVPHETPQLRERMKESFKERPVFFWEVEGKPVSMAIRSRETKDSSNISLVYTPPELRGKGYAGSATAFACEDVFTEGKQICFLYTDLRNPVSNKVYQKIGFRPWCDSETWVRVVE